MFFAWTTYAPNLYASAFARADGVKSQSQAAIAAFEEVKRKQEESIAQQQYLVRVEDRRFQMLDMLRAVETLLPRDDPGKVPENPADRNELHVERIDCQYFPDLAAWFTGVSQKWAETHPAEEAAEEQAEDEQGADTPPAGEPPAAEGDQAAEAPAAAAAPAAVTGPTGPGWVIQMTGYHFHNEDHHKPDESAQFVRSTIVKGLLGEGDEVAVTAGPLAGQMVSVADLGIGFPVLVDSSTVQVVRIPRGTAPAVPGTQPQGNADAEGAPDLVLRRFDFKLQFCWQPTVPGAPKPPPPPPAAPAQDF